jgi:hypothetical protein
MFAGYRHALGRCTREVKARVPFRPCKRRAPFTLAGFINC